MAPPHAPSPSLPEPIHVAVLVGTDHHPFDRLVSWVATLAAEDDQPWLVQHGATHLPPDSPPQLHGVPILGVEDLTTVLDRADVVVTHGGPGLIMEAHAARHVPVVVPRDPALGEHVDGHQQAFAARLAADGAIVVAHTLEQLRTAVHTTRQAERPTHGHAGTSTEVVTRFAELVEQTRARPRTSVLRRLLSR